MALDSYAACPCGSGKKIKFCAPKNTNAEMEKIIRAIEGDQRASALDQVKRLLETHPESQCLLSLKTDLEQVLGFVDEWRDSVALLLEKFPNDPNSHFRAALAQLEKGELETALASFHEGLYQREEESPLPATALVAMGQLIEASMMTGTLWVAAALLSVRQGLLSRQGVRDEQFLGFLADAQIPRAFKRIWDLPPAPDSAPWKEEYEVATQQFSRLRFRDALDILKSLSDKVQGEPLILRGVATVEQMLGDQAAILTAMKNYIASGGVDEDDLVDAHCLTYWLDEEHDTVEHVRRTFPVSDVDKLREHLANSDRMQQFDVGPQLSADEDTPPPQVAAHWFAAPLDLEAEQVAGELAAVIMFYGRETDREARVEVDIAKDARYDDQMSAIVSHLGDSVGASSGQESISHVTLLGHMTNRRARGVKITSLDYASEAQEKQHAKAVEEWFETPADCLGGKSPAECVGSDDARAALRGYWYNLQGIADSENWLGYLDAARDRLQLPRPDAAAATNSRTAINRLSDIELGDLDDDALLSITTGCEIHGLNGSTKRTFLEILSRPSMESQIAKSSLCMRLAQLARSSEAIEYARQAGAALKAEGQSPVDAMLLEMNVQLMRGEGDEVRSLLQVIEANHINEPGVVEKLQHILTFGGRIDPSAMQGEEQGAAPASEESSELWTPDSGPASGGGDDQQSKLWVPGMD